MRPGTVMLFGWFRRKPEVVPIVAPPLEFTIECPTKEGCEAEKEALRSENKVLRDSLLGQNASD